MCVCDDWYNLVFRWGEKPVLKPSFTPTSSKPTWVAITPKATWVVYRRGVWSNVFWKQVALLLVTTLVEQTNLVATTTTTPFGKKNLRCFWGKSMTFFQHPFVSNVALPVCGCGLIDLWYLIAAFIFCGWMPQGRVYVECFPHSRGKEQGTRLQDRPVHNHGFRCKRREPLTVETWHEFLLCLWAGYVQCVSETAHTRIRLNEDWRNDALPDFHVFVWADLESRRFTETVPADKLMSMALQDFMQ